MNDFEDKLMFDQAIQELRKALHWQYEICHRAPYDIDMVAIAQCGELIEHCLNQIRLLMIPSRVTQQINQQQRERVLEAELMVRRFGLGKLPDGDIAALLKLNPLPDLE